MKKYTDVDIVVELQKLVDSHVDSYKEDFDIDKRIIRRAAESQNPEDKTLMWFCRPHGTHCLNENQVFIQGTRDHNTFRFYAEQTYDECVARVIIPKAVKRGKVFGDVFEINYREQAANVAQNSAVPDHDRLTFADGFVLEAPCRSSFDEAMALVGEHGGVKTHQTLPKDAEALAEVLSKQKTRRDRLPDAERTEDLSPLSVAELGNCTVGLDDLTLSRIGGNRELYTAKIVPCNSASNTPVRHEPALTVKLRSTKPHHQILFI